jgi:hypothetical protein
MAIRIGRREFIVALGSGTAAWPGAVHAQQSTIPVIGFLHHASAEVAAALRSAFQPGTERIGLHRKSKRSDRISVG